jgi:DNA-binding NarL/FixJ family response regulator
MFQFRQIKTKNTQLKRAAETKQLDDLVIEIMMATSIDITRILYKEICPRLLPYSKQQMMFINAINEILSSHKKCTKEMVSDIIKKDLNNNLLKNIEGAEILSNQEKIIQLMYKAGFSTKLIAHVLGTTPSSIRGSKSQIKEKLSHILLNTE